MPEMYDRPPIAQAPLSLVLVEAEPGETGAVVSRWQAFLATRPVPSEILYVRPRAADAKPAQPGQFGYVPGESFGVALSAALRAAQYPLVALAPADDSVRPAAMQHLLGVIDHADLVVGCRMGRPIPLWRRALDRAVSITCTVLMGLPLPPRLNWPPAPVRRRRRLVRWLFGVRMQDPESPLRLARRDALVRFPLASGGPFALVEMLAKANHLTLLLAEEPVPATIAEEPEPAGFRQDLWRLFHAPDFGPAVAKEAEPPPAPGGDSGNLLA